MLRSESYVVPPSASNVNPADDYPFYVTANRYWKPEHDALGGNRHGPLINNISGGYGDGGGEGNDGDGRQGAKQDAALTLIVLHSTSFHKETWEPSLETLFDVVSASNSSFSVNNLSTATSTDSKANKRRTRRRVNISEAWSIECPNHGKSAALNDQVLQQPEYADDFGCDKYAQAVHRFLTSGPINFQDRTFVGIGHSLGANTILLLQRFQPVLKFDSIVIVEPMLSPDGSEHLAPLRSHLVKAARKRRDIWKSREEALAYWKGKDKKRLGPGKWDERVLRLFVQYALRPAPSSRILGPNSRDMGYTLSCTRRQEVAMYLDELGPTEPVLDLNRICSYIPIHVIVGTIHDFIPAAVQKALVNTASGRQYASITRIPDIGHLIPQERPDDLAEAIFNALSWMPPPTPILNSRPAPKSASHRRSRTADSKL